MRIDPGACALAVVLLLSTSACAAEEAATPVACNSNAPQVRVLGSGGPETADRRASSAYLVHDGKRNRVLVDAGGGSALRFGQADATVGELDAVLFTHLHADHTSDFPSLVKSSYFENRKRALPVFGPGEGGAYPSTTTFIQALFGGQGAWRYLQGHLGGGDDYSIVAGNVSPEPGTVLTVLSDDDLDISAARVTHGPVPATAWRIDLGDFSVVFSGDTNGNDGVLELLAKDADLFVAHNAVPEGARGAARRLHMPPSLIGEIAASANVGKVVLSHRMRRTLGREDETLAAIRRSYAGEVRFADDLDCFTAVTAER